MASILLLRTSHEPHAAQWNRTEPSSGAGALALPLSSQSFSAAFYCQPSLVSAGSPSRRHARAPITSPVGGFSIATGVSAKTFAEPPPCRSPSARTPLTCDRPARAGPATIFIANRQPPIGSPRAPCPALAPYCGGMASPIMSHLLRASSLFRNKRSPKHVRYINNYHQHCRGAGGNTQPGDSNHPCRETPAMIVHAIDLRSGQARRATRHRVGRVERAVLQRHGCRVQQRRRYGPLPARWTVPAGPSDL